MTTLLLADGWFPESLVAGLFAAGLYGLVGIVLIALGFKVFEWITPKLHVEEELAKGNMAVAVVVAAVVIGISLIALRAISG